MGRFQTGRILRKRPFLAGAMIVCCAVVAGCTVPASPAGSATVAGPTPATADESALPDPAGEVVPNVSRAATPTVSPAASIPRTARQSTGPAAAGTTAVPDAAACRLLTPAEINAATGLSVTDGKPDVGAALPGQVSCVFLQQLPTGLRVSLFRRDDSHTLFNGLLPSAQSVSGLGDEAKATAGNGTAAIAVRKGSMVITLFVVKNQSPAVTVAAVKDLASSALRRV
jgi:hypothetical protein